MNGLKKRQLKIDALLKGGICPVCASYLKSEWNKFHTHKYEFCPMSESHHKKLIDYVKDEDQ